jgi:hypothetical protein
VPKRAATIVSIAILLGVAVVVLSRRESSEFHHEAGLIDPGVSSKEPDRTYSTGSALIRFEQLAADQTGVAFQYYGSPSEQHYLTEQNGGGVALFDIDGDGQLDLYFVNGSHFQELADLHNASNTCYRNTGEFRFQDVTHQANLTAFNFGQGCACGDYNNDGFIDLFVACFGSSRLWRNNGDGTFREVTELALPGNEGFASSAAFADLDADGDLDLYVVNYLDWKPDDKSRDRVPSPMEYSGQADCLYQNMGDGVFEDVGETAGVSIAGDGKGLAVAIADLNGDGQLDIYVANDTTRNFLFLNRGAMVFEEMGVAMGCAVSENGTIGSSMGVAVSDYNRDGRPDLFVTNFANEVLDVLMNYGESGFLATNAELGIDRVSRPLLNFGIAVDDFDLDSWPDLFFANGHLWDETPSGGQFQMPPSILSNREGRRFIDVGESAGTYFQQKWLGRAAAVGDLDNDGDPDLVISHLVASPAILKNESPRQGLGQRMRFVGRVSSRQPLGCQVSIRFKDETEVVRDIRSGGSFQACHDTVVIAPISDSRKIEHVSIRWPDGTTESWATIAAGDELTLIEGTGRSNR